MFIKIYCDNTEQFLLIQSNDAFLDKSSKKTDEIDFILLCKFIDEMSKPVSEQDIEKIKYLNEKFSQRRVNGSGSIGGYYCDLIPNTPFDIVAPVLSSEQESKVYNVEYNEETSKVVPQINLNTVFVGDKLYITTGNIFIMNDDGKTIDRIF